jgi:quinoprotein glucose dehydrogenase
MFLPINKISGQMPVLGSVMRTWIMAVALAALAGPAMAADTDWVSYGHDAGGNRYSPLTQITPANVDQLTEVWRYHMNPTPMAAPAPGGRQRALTSQDTPVEAGGMLFLATPYGRVVALDSTSGKQIWAYQLASGDQPSERGVAYWPGGGKGVPRSCSARCAAAWSPCRPKPASRWPASDRTASSI